MAQKKLTKERISKILEELSNTKDVFTMVKDRVYWMRVTLPPNIKDKNDKVDELANVLRMLHSKGLDQVIVSDASDMSIQLQDVTEFVNDHTNFDKLEAVLKHKLSEYSKKKTKADKKVCDVLSEILSTWVYYKEDGDGQAGE